MATHNNVDVLATTASGAPMATNDYRIRSKATPQAGDGQRATSRANKLA